MRKLILAGGLSLLVLPGASAFAGEGSFQPQAVASVASGAGGYAGIGQSFVYNAGEGGQAAPTPAFTVGGLAPAPVAAGGNPYNAGLNG